MNRIGAGRALLLAALAALAVPSAASAHLRTGTVAVDYRASVSTPRPSAHPPFRVGIYASDLAVHLTVSAGHTVVVRGYLGKPFLRLGPAGRAVDTSSPTAAATGLLAKDASHGDGWQLRRGVRSAVWHDVRVSSLARGADAERWTIPILVDGRPGRIAGRTWRLEPPPLWPWACALALFAIGGVAAWRRGRLVRATIVLGALAATAGVVTAAGFAVDAYASPGTWIEAIDETAFAAAGAVLLLVLGSTLGKVASAGGLGLLAIAVGLSKGAIFLDGGVLSVFPATLARLFAATAIAAGLAAAVTGGLWFAARERAAQPTDWQRMWNV